MIFSFYLYIRKFLSYRNAVVVCIISHSLVQTLVWSLFWGNRNFILLPSRVCLHTHLLTYVLFYRLQPWIQCPASVVIVVTLVSSIVSGTVFKISPLDIIWIDFFESYCLSNKGKYHLSSDSRYIVLSSFIASWFNQVLISTEMITLPSSSNLWIWCEEFHVSLFWR